VLNLILANISSLKKISPNQLQKTLSEVSVLFSKGDLEASEKALNQLIISFPSHPEVLSKLGTIYLYQDKLNEGIQLIKKSLEVNPYQPDILNNYAVALLNISHPKEALKEAAKILIHHFMLFSDEKITLDTEEKASHEEFDEAYLHMRQLLKTKLYDMDLSVRALNCLKAADVETLGQLVAFNKTDLLKFRNFGKKSLTELEDLVHSKNLQFGMNISKYRIDED
jgi:DNA-directed RNA polymerase subunit alpha